MRKTLVSVLASLLALAMATPAAATAKDDDPIVPFPIEPVPVHTACAFPLDPEPPTPVYGELPVLDDPVHSTADGVACSPSVEGGAFTNVDVEVVIAKVDTEWDFNKANQPQPGQITIKTIISPANQGDVVVPLNITYKVTVTVGNNVRTEDVTVQVNLAQGTSGAVGGFNVTSLNPPIPQGAKVKVETVNNTIGQLRIANIVQRGFTIKPTNHGEKVKP